MEVEIYLGLTIQGRMEFLNFYREEIPKTPLSIIDLVCSKLKVEKEKFFSKKRDRNLVIARKIAIGLCCEMTSYTMVGLADIFNCDHSTIIYHREDFNDLKSVKDKIILKALETINSETI